MASSLTPSERFQRARIAALARWSREDPSANAERGQRGLVERFRREILAEDPDVVEPELSRRVEARRRLHMERMAYRSVRARRARREAGSAASVRNAEAP